MSIEWLDMDKAVAYASALPDDISAERFQVVENGKLWRGWIGTVYGMAVSTQERGHKFLTKPEAVANARLFVEQCKNIVEAK